MIYYNFYGGRAIKIAIGITMLVFMLSGGAGAMTITVNASGGGDYLRIQDAIDNASTGDEILVYSGLYYEGANVNKKLVLKGIGNPMVDAKNGVAFILSVDGIRLEGFTVIYAGEEGIRITSSNNILVGNIISNIDGNGIDIFDCSNNTLIGNNVLNSAIHGIQLSSSNNNTLRGNNVDSNSEDDGIIIIASYNNTLVGNNISNNGNNGIHLYSSSNNNLTENSVSSNNFAGIYMGISNDNTVTGNNLSSNGRAFYISFSSNNRIYHNNIINNYNQISYYSEGVNQWDNGYPEGGNYWSDFTGADNKKGLNQDQIGGDGIGDTPYNISGSGAGAQDRYPLMNPYQLKSQGFRLAHITDVHIGYNNVKSSGMKDSVLSFTDTLQGLRNESPKPEIILVTGDLVENRDEDFFKAFRNLIGWQAINFGSAIIKTTPGNHDRRWGLLFNDLSTYNTLINTPINYETLNSPIPINSDGGIDYAFDFKGYRFIGLDSGADYNTGVQELAEGLLGLDLGPESDGLKISQVGEFNNNAPKIIFMHHPIISSKDDFWGEDVEYSYLNNPIPNDCLDKDGKKIGGNDNTIGKNRCNFINYAKENNVQLVLTGHSHTDAIFNKNGDTVDENSIDRPMFIQTLSPGYRIIDVKNGIAYPKITEVKPTGLHRVTGVFDPWTNIGRFGLEAKDSLGRYTGRGLLGMVSIGIPDSYATGDYEGGVTPQVIVGYYTNDADPQKITEFKACSLIYWSSPCYDVSPQAMRIRSAQSFEDFSFNMTVEDQTGTSTTEIKFYNVSATESSMAKVNVNNTTNYVMDLDLNGDGTTDLIKLSDSITKTSEYPQNNISILTYNGEGTINITTSAGNITSAGNMNVSMFPEKQYYEFPHGLISLNVSGVANGSIVNITISLPENLAANAQYLEYGKTADNNTSRWYRIPLGSNNGDNIITLQLQDGGAGDDDGILNGAILTTGGPGITSMPGISGAVIDRISKTGISGATVLVNASITTITDSFGFYSLAVSEGEYNLIAKLDPVYYMNNTIPVSTFGQAVAEQDIELLKKPMGTITGKITGTPGVITVINPNGGENWTRGTTKTISWSYTGNPGTNVKIDLLKNGVFNRTIFSTTPNDKSQSWTISSTQTPGTDYKIKITSTTNLGYNDTTDNNFTISI